MNKDFWLNLWQKNHIPFHSEETHRFLRQYWPALNIKPNTAVFVPLCGKTLDMLWLSQHHKKVIGIELSTIAIEQFFAESKIDYKKSAVDEQLQLYQSDLIDIYCGDFFTLSKEHLPEIGITYDRAALVALPAELRARYVAHLTQLLDKDHRLFLISNTYEQSLMEGPPFSVNEKEITTLFKEHFTIECLHQQSTSIPEDKDLYQRGLREISHQLYWLSKR